MRDRKALQMGLLVLLSLVLATITTAQSDATLPPDPQIIRTSAVDDLVLVGSYYALPDVQAPTALLLHEPNGSRDNWAEFIEPLWQAGYHILAVDLRGYGETGGDANWEAALDDVQIWLDWLYEQPEVQPTGISVIGADLSGNLAVIGCENDSTCLTAIALAPVALGCAERDCSVEIESVGETAVAFLDEMSVLTLTDHERRSSAILLSARGDDLSLESIQQIGSSRSSQVALSLTTGSGHGTELGSAASPVIIRWLDARIPPNLTPDAIEALVAAGDPSNGEVLFAEGIAGVPEEEGRRCAACHFTDSEEKYHAPGLLNIGVRAGTRVEGQSAAVYLYTSIVAPDSYLVDSYTAGIMPWRYDKGFTEGEIADLVAYLLTLES